jgi:DNA-binding transcriptional LysR family regulator
MHDVGEPIRNGHRSMIEDLNLLRAFVSVVETGSFSEAGRRLQVVPSTISKHIAALETRLGGQLVVRSTKRLSVTELGRRFYDRCLSILREVEEAEIEVGEYKAEPQGLLRLTAGTVFATHHLAPIFARFCRAYPKVDLQVSLTTQNEDLVANGYDVGIRISGDLDPGLIALKLAPSSRLFCAAPSYLERHGIPKTGADLANHNCIVINAVSQSRRWPVRSSDGSSERVVVSGNFTTDNGDLARQMLLEGLGIGHLARFMVHEHLESGELVEVLPECRSVFSHIYAIYPERRNMPLKTRAFLDHLRAEFRVPPAWA